MGRPQPPMGRAVVSIRCSSYRRGLMVRLSRSDLETVLDFAGEVRIAARAPERQDEQLLAKVASLVGVEMLKYQRFDASHRSHDVTVVGDQGPPRSDDLLEALRNEVNPYSAYAARTRQPYFSATRLYDVVNRKAFQRTHLYQLMPFADAPSAEIRMPAYGGGWGGGGGGPARPPRSGRS